MVVALVIIAFVTERLVVVALVVVLFVAIRPTVIVLDAEELAVKKFVVDALVTIRSLKNAVVAERIVAKNEVEVAASVNRLLA